MLFVLRKIGGEKWRIARYCFSTTNPPSEREKVEDKKDDEHD